MMLDPDVILGDERPKSRLRISLSGTKTWYNYDVQVPAGWTPWRWITRQDGPAEIWPGPGIESPGPRLVWRLPLPPNDDTENK